MPKLNPKTAIFRVIDRHSFKDGALFREIREQCKSWKIPPDAVDEAIQSLLENHEIEEPIIGYIRRRESE